MEGLMLKLKLQPFGHLMQRTDSLKKTLILGKVEGRRRGTTVDKTFGWHHWLCGHVWVSSRSWWWTGKPGGPQSRELPRVRHRWMTELKWSFLWICYSCYNSRWLLNSLILIPLFMNTCFLGITCLSECCFKCI